MDSTSILSELPGIFSYIRVSLKFTFFDAIFINVKISPIIKNANDNLDVFCIYTPLTFVILHYINIVNKICWISRNIYFSIKFLLIISI